MRLGPFLALALLPAAALTNAEVAEKRADGRGYADVPGNAKATYRIFTRNGKVTEITLQDKHQNCYE